MSNSVDPNARLQICSLCKRALHPEEVYIDSSGRKWSVHSEFVHEFERAMVHVLYEFRSFLHPVTTPEPATYTLRTGFDPLHQENPMNRIFRLAIQMRSLPEDEPPESEDGSPEENVVSSPTIPEGIDLAGLSQELGRFVLLRDRLKEMARDWEEVDHFLEEHRSELTDDLLYEPLIEAIRAQNFTMVRKLLGTNVLSEESKQFAWVEALRLYGEAGVDHIMEDYKIPKK